MGQAEGCWQQWPPQPAAVMCSGGGTPRLPLQPCVWHALPWPVAATTPILPAHAFLTAGVYSKTVNLPATKFDMRANSVVREPQLQQFWQESKIYEQLSRANPGVRSQP